MSVKVIFRGLILFRTDWVNKKEVIVEALLPNTGRPPKQGSLDGKKHHDNKEARRHHPGLLRVPGPKAIDITHAVIDFSPGSGGPLYADASPVLDSFPRIDRVKQHPGEPLLVDADAPVAARVDMRFAKLPRLSGTDVEADFKFGDLSGLPLALVATFEEPINVRVTTVASPPLTVNVENGETLYIYHADDVDPDDKKLTEKKPNPEPGDEDIDFKWYYSLVEPRGDLFENWATGGLPVPVYAPGDPDATGRTHPRVSTCFPAWI